MKKKTIVVTGADRGLGYELVKQYVERDDFVIAGKFRINWHLLEELKEKYPDRMVIVDMDVSSTESVRNAAKEVEKIVDHVDIIINNAGVWLSHGSGDILQGDYDYDRMIKEFNINALGSLRVCEAFAPLLVKGRDKIVANVSSEAGSISGNFRDREPGYGMSKCALNMQSAIVHQTLKQMGGGVINLHPGWMQSVIGTSEAADAPFVPLPEDIMFYNTPAMTASYFIEILDDPNRFSSDKPAFVNYRGDVLHW